MWFEHWHRYRLVAPITAGKRVLDIACGEGYGTAALATHAASVTGVDISATAIAHATHAYSGLPNVRFSEGSCTAIPAHDQSMDVVVSFETLEHITDHDAFMREVRRVLVPDGLFIVSTPNKAEYTDARGYQNEFHVRELYQAEFESWLAAGFAHTRLLGQRNGFHSHIAPPAPPGSRAGEGTLAVESMPARAGEAPAPLYFIAFASNSADALSAVPQAPSAFTAFEDNQVDVFMQIWRHSQHLEGRVAELTQQNEALQAALAAQPQVQPSEPAVGFFSRLFNRRT